MTVRQFLTGLWRDHRRVVLGVVALYFAATLSIADEFSARAVLSAAVSTLLAVTYAIGALLLLVWTAKRVASLFGVSLEDRRSIRALTGIIAARRRRLDRLGEDRPLARSRTQFQLGIALGELGTQAVDTEALRQSVAEFRDALPALHAAGKHTKWALTQRNLAVSLLHLSRREIGTTSLEEAAAALKAAAEAWETANNKADWSEEQFLLCAVLTRLGRLTDGTTQLADAVAAGRRSLTAEDNSDVPLADARLKINLAEALAYLGERDGGTEQLDEAVAMARQSLQIIAEDQDDLLDDDEAIEWRAKQSGNLGLALRLLGERHNDTGLLIEAIETLRSTVSLRTQSNDYDWATNQHELACALDALARRAARPERPSQSLRASDTALSILTCETYPLDWAIATATRANTLAWLTRDSRDRTALRRVVKELQAALAVFDQAEAPVQRRQCRADLERAQALLNQAEDAGAETEDPAPPGPIKPRPA